MPIARQQRSRGPRESGPRRDRPPARRGFALRKKINRFYSIFGEKALAVDYKDSERLARFLTEKGKIIPRRITGLTSKQQRVLSHAIKRARHAGILAFQVASE